MALRVTRTHPLGRGILGKLGETGRALPNARFSILGDLPHLSTRRIYGADTRLFRNVVTCNLDGRVCAAARSLQRQLTNPHPPPLEVTNRPTLLRSEHRNSLILSG